MKIISKGVGILFKLMEIKEDFVTRNLIFKSEISGKCYDVFDDSMLIGDDQFDFLKEHNNYDCKFSILGDLSHKGELFECCGTEKIGKKSFIKVKNNNNDYFYFFTSENILSDRIRINVLRYDLLAVGKIINDR